MRWWTCIVILSVAAVRIESSGEEWFEVMTAQGPVRGWKDPTEDLYSFYSIPYATAPTGKHKFKAPLPPPTWKDTFDAIDRRIICPQAFAPTVPKYMVAQENCLITNIYVPKTKQKNLPVIVNIHGGGFQIGMGVMAKRKYLMKNKDVIIVNFNYRVGIHGFLCLGTEAAPGNAGMKDQVALLRWVQQNIAAFGGNPNDVTITGTSAGSAAVDLLMISKAAEGLFHKVIPESGTNIAVFTVQLDPLQNAKDHAKTLNFTNTNDIYALEEFYQTLSYDILTADDFMDRGDSTLMFTPCIERDTEENAFLTASPFSILTKGNYNKIPLLYGFANMEGLLRMGYFDSWLIGMNEKFSDFLPADLKFETEDEKENVAKLVKEFYFGDKNITNDSVLAYVDYFSDVMFCYPALRAVKLYVESGHNEVYLYEYSFTDEDTPVVPYTTVRGASHCAQSQALGDGINDFYTIEDTISGEFRNIKKIIRELWLNFVKTGQPVPMESSLPEWPPVGVDRSPHMSLGQKVELRGVLLENRTRFWDNIYQKYYREPIPPPQPPPKS